MITSWMLVILMHYDRSGSISTIQNLKSVDECKRVELVIRDWLGRNRIRDTKCIEVIHKDK